MGNPGITSQYGFLYQRKVFILYALENASTKQTYIYEGKDDIDVDQSEALCSATDNTNICVQVKSGKLSEACFYKVIGNWLLLDTIPSGGLVLFTENSLDFSVEYDDIKAPLKEFFMAGETQKKTAIARKVFDKYKKDLKNVKDPDSWDLIVKNILQKMEQRISGMDTLDKNMEDIFFKSYCQDIVEFSMAKKKRLERVCALINRDIDQSFGKKKSFSLPYSDLIRIIMQASDEIRDDRYVPDISYIRSKVKEQAKQLAGEEGRREVWQLKLVSSRQEFIVDGIVKELMYKDFRDIYIEKQTQEVLNSEQNAYENYKMSIFELEDDADLTSKKIYTRTVSKPVAGKLMPEGLIYGQGCYIYLTRDDIDEEKQITWEV